MTTAKHVLTTHTNMKNKCNNNRTKLTATTTKQPRNKTWSLVPNSSLWHLSVQKLVFFLQRSSSIEGGLPTKVDFHRKSSTIKSCPSSKAIFHQSQNILSSTKCCLASKVLFHRRTWDVLHQRSSSSYVCLPPKVVFHRRSSSPKVVFHQMLSSTKGRLPRKVIFHQRSSSTEGHLPPKIVFHRRLFFT